MTPGPPAGSAAGGPGALVDAHPALAQAAGPAWTAYVVNNDADAVTPVNTETDTAGTPIPVGDDPFAIAITPDGRTAYVANQTAGTLTPINLATRTPGAAIPI